MTKTETTTRRQGPAGARHSNNGNDGGGCIVRPLRETKIPVQRIQRISLPLASRISIGLFNLSPFSSVLTAQSRMVVTNRPTTRNDCNPFKPPPEHSSSAPCCCNNTNDGGRRCLAAVLLFMPALAYALFGTHEVSNHIHTKMRSITYRPMTIDRAEQYAVTLMRSNPESIKPKHIGEAGRLQVENVFWLHIQKCGTSLFNTLWLHFCPKILDKNPKLAKRTDLIEYDLIKDYPIKEWCDGRTFYNYPRVGFHWPWKPTHWGVQKRNGGPPQTEDFHSFAMFRNSVERLKSAFSFRETTKADVPHYSHLNDPDISIEEYFAEPHIPNCQIKMVMGYRCHHYVNPRDLDVKEALRRISSPSFYFGITDRWDESICLFHYWYGGETQPFELLNNRPTKRLDISTDEDELDRELVDVDAVFVAGAAKIFEERIKLAGC